MRSTKCEDAKPCENPDRCEKRPLPGEKLENPFSLHAIITAFLQGRVRRTPRE